ncbi:MAG: monovalent cation/H(+) antiporter subunit G [Pleurocapsa minor GSE-CHR-MK-17-07R]|jgi:multicomponent Na+:H+ antiporter subunit G|nr:monovalent cation/H(+) antiporter subunit G [Pleurocapsa minor GSE-CHR-MK 17-07R]
MLGEIIGLLFILSGVTFCALGVLGIMRLPDVYSRIHASGKVAILGIFGLLAGTAILLPEATLKLLGLGVFILLTSPVASHAIAAAAYRSGVPLKQATRDDLAERNRAIAAEE